MKFNKDSIKTIVIVVLLILLVGIIFVPLLYNFIYNNGFVNGQVNVAITQTEKKNIFIINNETVQEYSWKVLCQALDRSNIR